MKLLRYSLIFILFQILLFSTHGLANGLLNTRSDFEDSKFCRIYKCQYVHTGDLYQFTMSKYKIITYPKIAFDVVEQKGQLTGFLIQVNDRIADRATQIFLANLIQLMIGKKYTFPFDKCVSVHANFGQTYTSGNNAVKAYCTSSADTPNLWGFGLYY